MVAAAFTLGGRLASPSSCFAADERTISCVSVSLVMFGTLKMGVRSIRRLPRPRAPAAQSSTGRLEINSMNAASLARSLFSPFD
jgi:hypothetical protein